MASLGNSTLRRMLGLTAAALVAVGSPAVSGPTVTIRRLESLLVQSGLAGTVRCVTAGEDVATFEVLESWKGPPAGSRVTICRWRPPRPIRKSPFSEPGQEFVVLAHRDASAAGESAFACLVGQGFVRLPLVPHVSLKSAFGHPGRGYTTLRRAALESATTADACVAAWLDAHRRGRREANLTCLALAGGRRTLALLERIDVAKDSVDEVQLGMALAGLRRTFPGEPPPRKYER